MLFRSVSQSRYRHLISGTFSSPTPVLNSSHYRTFVCFLSIQDEAAYYRYRCTWISPFAFNLLRILYRINISIIQVSFLDLVWLLSSDDCIVITPTVSCFRILVVECITGFLIPFVVFTQCFYCNVFGFCCLFLELSSR